MFIVSEQLLKLLIPVYNRAVFLFPVGRYFLTCPFQDCNLQTSYVRPTLVLAAAAVACLFQFYLRFWRWSIELSFGYFSAAASQRQPI